MQMMKRIIAGMLLIAILFCGVAVAEEEFGTLRVTVVDTTDSHNPIANAEIQVTSVDKIYNKPQRTTLDGDGSVDFVSVPYGEYTITVSKERYITQVKNNVTVNSQLVSETFLLAQDNPVMITVKDEVTGQPLQNAEVKVNNANPVLTDAYGRAYIVMIRGASNSILVNANSYLPYSETRYITADTTTIDIPMTLAEASPLFLVYNEAKSPVSGATITVDGKLIAYTDSYGRAQLPTYTAGVNYSVNISCNGYIDYNDNIKFTTDKADYVITLTYASSPVRVTVKTDSKVLPNALVYFDGANKGVTGTDGTFTATADPGKTILISASLDGYTGDSVTCTVQANTANEVVILMKENFPTTIVGLSALAAIIVLLIVILLVVGKNRKNKGNNGNGKNTYAPTRKRDSL